MSAPVRPSIMQPAALSQPVGAFMRPTQAVFIEDSLSAAAQRMRENGTSLIPVVKGERFSGVVSESSLASALAAGAEPNHSIAAALRPGTTCQSYITGAAALRTFEEQGVDTLVVIDDHLHVVGLLLPSDLLQRDRRPMRPPLVGGMATPYGVYLTTGSVHGGVRQILLVTTGMAMFVMMAVASLGASFLADLGPMGQQPLLVQDSAFTFLTFAFFALQMRLLPISGIHAAEHKVVHAIERGEELTPEVVRRMPRVHPRCGTNLAVGATIFSGVLFGAPFAFVPQELRFLLAAILTVMLWRPLGSLAQYWITTRPPTEKHIRMGIRAGKEVLERYQTARVASPTIGMRLLNSGLFHVLAGSSFCAVIVAGAAWVLGYHDFVRGILSVR